MVLIIMGVVGVGKTTVGRLVAEKLGWQFADADDFHPAANVEKIRRGIPLDDEDRAPWLASLQKAIVEWNAKNENAVLACSALKQKYRDRLSADGVRFVYLEGAPELIRQRLGARRGHFATDSILASQFRDLEVPEDAIAVPVDKTPGSIAEEILTKLKRPDLRYPDAAHP
ncbi:MAG: gluconokinase [Acidobacteria bacterium]|nr:gluconokinase [Acidobacteriota bacterium]